MGSSYEFQRGGERKRSVMFVERTENNNTEILITSMETQCLSKVWKTEKKQIRQGTSKRKETDWE